MQLRKEQFELRMQKISGQLTNPNRLTQVRKDIARVKTAQNGGLSQSKAGVKAPKAPKASNKPVPQMKTTANVKAEPAKKPAAKKPAAKKAAKE